MIENFKNWLALKLFFIAAELANLPQWRMYTVGKEIRALHMTRDNVTFFRSIEHFNEKPS